MPFWPFVYHCAVVSSSGFVICRCCFFCLHLCSSSPLYGLLCTLYGRCLCCLYPESFRTDPVSFSFLDILLSCSSNPVLCVCVCVFCCLPAYSLTSAQGVLSLPPDLYRCPRTFLVGLGACLKGQAETCLLLPFPSDGSHCNSYAEGFM